MHIGAAECRSAEFVNGLQLHRSHRIERLPRDTCTRLDLGLAATECKQRRSASARSKSRLLRVHERSTSEEPQIRGSRTQFELGKSLVLKDFNPVYTFGRRASSELDKPQPTPLYTPGRRCMNMPLFSDFLLTSQPVTCIPTGDPGGM